MLGIGLHDPASFSLPPLTLHTQRELKKSMSVTLRQRGKSTHPGGLPVLLLQYPLQGSLLLGREPMAATTITGRRGGGEEAWNPLNSNRQKNKHRARGKKGQRVVEQKNRQAREKKGPSLATFLSLELISSKKAN